MSRHGGGRAWSSRGRRRPDAHVARINDIANGLAAASLALQVDDDITARQAIDESLRQASGMLTEAVERADARERRQRAGTWAAGLTTAAAAAVTAFAVSFPASTPSDAPGFVASDEHAAEVADEAALDDVSTWIDELAHREPDEVVTTRLVAHATEGAKRTREAAAAAPTEEPEPPARARAGGPEASAVSRGGTAITAATPPSSGGSSAPRSSASTTSSTSGTSGSVSTASEPAAEPETHPGKIQSGRADPSDNAQPEPGPAPHSNGRGNNA